MTRRLDSSRCLLLLRHQLSSFLLTKVTLKWQLVPLVTWLKIWRLAELLRHLAILRSVDLTMDRVLIRFSESVRRHLLLALSERLIPCIIQILLAEERIGLRRYGLVVEVADVVIVSPETLSSFWYNERLLTKHCLLTSNLHLIPATVKVSVFILFIVGFNSHSLCKMAIFVAVFLVASVNVVFFHLVILWLGVGREESFHWAKRAYYLLEEAALVILVLGLFLCLTNSMMIPYQVLTFVEHAIIAHQTVPSLRLVVRRRGRLDAWNLLPHGGGSWPFLSKLMLSDLIVAVHYLKFSLIFGWFNQIYFWQLN